MNKIYSLSFVAAVVASLLFTGCKKDSSTAATTETAAQVSFGVQSDNPLVTLASLNPGGSLAIQAVTGTASVTWTAATANVAKFKLNAKKSGVAFEVVSNGLLNIDLFAAIPSTISAVIANGTYTNVELHVVLAKSTTTTYPLVLKGNYTTKAGNIIPIEFDFNDDAEIVAITNDLTIDGKNDVLAKVSLHLNKLLSNITAQEIDQTVRTNSMILITSTVNPVVYAKIKTDLLLSGGSNVTATVKK